MAGVAAMLGAEDRAALLHTQDASPSAGWKGWGRGGLSPARMGAVRRRGRGPCTAVSCLALAAGAGAEAAPHPRKSGSPAAAVGGAEADWGGGLPARGRGHQQLGRRPSTDSQRPQRES
jgi:hypothetical protein